MQGNVQNQNKPQDFEFGTRLVIKYFRFGLASLINNTCKMDSRERLTRKEARKE